MQPDPALGVLGAPVVADHAAPAGDLGAAAAGLDPAAEHGVRARALELGPRQRRAVHPRARQVAQRPAPRPPPRGPTTPCGRAPTPSRGSRAGGGAGSDSLTAYGGPGLGVPDRAPERAGRLLAGPLVRRMTDPRAAGALRIDGAQVVRLVPAVALQPLPSGDRRTFRRAMPLCFIEPQDAIRVIAESVGREARRQLLCELVHAWVDEIPEEELASHYAKAVADLDENDLSMLAAWHASMEVGTPIANKDFLVGAFASLGENRREALKIAAGLRGEDAFNAGFAEDQALEMVLPWLSPERATELAAECLELYCWDRLGCEN